MKKRIFTLMLSVLFVLGLVACGNKQEERPAGNTESEPAVSAQPEENVETEKLRNRRTGNLLRRLETRRRKMEKRLWFISPCRKLRIRKT